MATDVMCKDCRFRHPKKHRGNKVWGQCRKIKDATGDKNNLCGHLTDPEYACGCGRKVPVPRVLRNLKPAES